MTFDGRVYLIRMGFSPWKGLKFNPRIDGRGAGASDLPGCREHNRQPVFLMRDYQFWAEKLAAAHAEVERLNSTAGLWERKHRILRKFAAKATYAERKPYLVGIRRAARSAAMLNRKVRAIKGVKIPYYMAQMSRLEKMSRWERMRRDLI